MTVRKYNVPDLFIALSGAQWPRCPVPRGHLAFPSQYHCSTQSGARRRSQSATPVSDTSRSDDPGHTRRGMSCVARHQSWGGPHEQGKRRQSGHHVRGLPALRVGPDRCCRHHSDAPTVQSFICRKRRKFTRYPAHQERQSFPGTSPDWRTIMQIQTMKVAADNAQVLARLAALKAMTVPSLISSAVTERG